MPVRSSILVDSGPFVARYMPEDRDRARLERFLERAHRERTFGNWYTVEAVVGETFTHLRREVGLATAREFLQHLGAGAPRVVPVPWGQAASLILEEPASRLLRGFTFTDASLVVAARSLGTRSILTTNPGDFRPFGLIPLP